MLTRAAPCAAIMMPTPDIFLTTSFSDNLERSAMTSTSRPVLRAAAMTASSLLNTRPFVLHQSTRLTGMAGLQRTRACEPAGDDEYFPWTVVVVAGDKLSRQARPVVGCLTEEPRVRTSRENVGVRPCKQTPWWLDRARGA